MNYLVIFFFFPVMLFGFDYHLKPYKIQDGINCFFGLPSQVSYINGGNMINSCYIESSEGYIVIDSGPTYNYAQEAYNVMQKKKKLPVKYVINTCSDEVHVLGSEFYKEQGATIFAPLDYKEFLKGKESLVLTHLLSPDAMFNTRMVALDNYIKEDTKILLGDLNLSIKVVDGDRRHIYVYMKDKKIIFAGDMVFNNRIVPLKYNRSLVVWEKALDKLVTLEWTDIVSAHGYMTQRSAIKYTKNYLNRLKKVVTEGIKNGKSKDEMVKNTPFPKFVNDRQYEHWHPINIAVVYDELKGMLTKKDRSSKQSVLSSKIFNNESSTKVIQKKSIIKREPKIKSLSVHYVTFAQAIKHAKAKKKIVLVKVRSTTCKYCDQLDRVLKRNRRVKKLLNRYFEVVKVNNDYEDAPLGIVIRSTPTLIFIQPENKKVLMNLRGIRALGELLEVLQEAVNDGHKDGYLRP